MPPCINSSRCGHTCVMSSAPHASITVFNITNIHEGTPASDVTSARRTSSTIRGSFSFQSSMIEVFKHGVEYISAHRGVLLISIAERSPVFIPVPKSLALNDPPNLRAFPVNIRLSGWRVRYEDTRSRAALMWHWERDSLLMGMYLLWALVVPDDLEK